MEKMHELAIQDVKKLTEGKKVKVQMASAILIYMEDAIVIADPDSGMDGKIAILIPDTGCKIELDSEELIDIIYGNDKEITINFFNNMGVMDISIIGDANTKSEHVINQDELCQFIKDKLDKLSKFTKDDIDLILDLETEYLRNKGIAN